MCWKICLREYQISRRIEFHRVLPRSKWSVYSSIQRLRQVVELDDEKAQRQCQEDVYSKQLGASGGGADQHRRNPGRIEAPRAPTLPTDKKQLISQKDKQINARAGQLKQAGMKLGFAAARSNSQQRRGRDGGKAGGKGGKSTRRAGRSRLFHLRQH